MQLECLRSEYSLPKGEHYLNCAFMSPISRPVENAGASAMQRLRWPGEFTSDDFFAEADQARHRFARLIGATNASRIAIVPSVSYGIALAARNVDLPRGANVVIAGGQFPSNVHIWMKLAERSGATVRTVERPGAMIGRAATWSERILDAIDHDTAVVALGTVDWTDGTPFALNEIGVRARAVGAAYILDGIQSIGALPFDLGIVRPDLMVASAYKWLGGPTGIGAAFIGERFAQADPIEETWLGRAGSDNFSHLTDYDVEYRSTAERFDQGGRAQHVLLPMLNAALEQLLTRDPARIQAYCRDLVLTLSNALVSLGFDIDAEEDRCNHLFAVRLPHGLSALAAQRWLKSQCRVHVAVRESSLRVSPNVYNDESDMDALATGLAAISRRSTPTMLHAFRAPASAWRSHAQ